VVGFGGYASVPTMVAARLRLYRRCCMSKNAVLGKANRMVLGARRGGDNRSQRVRHLENDARARA